jgi:hypothetical protein
MLYFTPKRDLKMLEELFALEQTYLDSYIKLLVHAEAKHITVISLDMLPQETRREYAENTREYSRLRASVNEYVHPFDKLTERYAAVDPTSYFLEATKLPDYGRSRPQMFNETDRAYWLDKTYALRGAIKQKKSEDFWHLVNPLYWVYAFFHSILHFTGLGKIVGEQIAKVISALLTVAMAAAAPWIKQLVVAWFKHFSAK